MSRSRDDVEPYVPLLVVALTITEFLFIYTVIGLTAVDAFFMTAGLATVPLLSKKTFEQWLSRPSPAGQLFCAAEWLVTCVVCTAAPILVLAGLLSVSIVTYNDCGGPQSVVYGNLGLVLLPLTGGAAAVLAYSRGATVDGARLTAYVAVVVLGVAGLYLSLCELALVGLYVPFIVACHLASRPLDRRRERGVVAATLALTAAVWSAALAAPRPIHPSGELPAWVRRHSVEVVAAVDGSSFWLTSRGTDADVTEPTGSAFGLRGSRRIASTYNHYDRDGRLLSSRTEGSFQFSSMSPDGVATITMAGPVMHTAWLGRNAIVLQGDGRSQFIASCHPGDGAPRELDRADELSWLVGPVASPYGVAVVWSRHEAAGGTRVVLLRGSCSTNHQRVELRYPTNDLVPVALTDDGLVVVRRIGTAHGCLVLEPDARLRPLVPGYHYERTWALAGNGRCGALRIDGQRRFDLVDAAQGVVTASYELGSGGSKVHVARGGDWVALSPDGGRAPLLRMLKIGDDGTASEGGTVRLQPNDSVIGFCGPGRLALCDRRDPAAVTMAEPAGRTRLTARRTVVARVAPPPWRSGPWFWVLAAGPR